MEKIICDICGSEFDESLSQCPICGCAKKEAAPETAETAYVKGGRFSKSNVRRRMKPETAGAASESVREYVKNNDDRNIDRQNNDEEADDEQEPRSNRPLLLVVILLLLAIIAVSLYIVIAFSDPADSGDANTSSSTTIHIVDVNGPCTSVQFSVSEVKLDKTSPNKKLTVIVEPVNTQDTLSFESSDASIVKVDNQGNLTALKKGMVTITVRCGSHTATVKVVSEYEVPTTVTTTQPTTQPTTKPTLPQNSPFIIPGGAVAVTPYKIRITYADGGVNIRKGPGTSYDKVTDKAYLNEEYTVVATFDDPNRDTDWALTDKGWITLEYAQRIS